MKKSKKPEEKSRPVTVTDQHGGNWTVYSQTDIDKLQAMGVVLEDQNGVNAGKSIVVDSFTNLVAAPETPERTIQKLRLEEENYNLRLEVYRGRRSLATERLDSITNSIQVLKLQYQLKKEKAK